MSRSKTVKMITLEYRIKLYGNTFIGVSFYGFGKGLSGIVRFLNLIRFYSRKV